MLRSIFLFLLVLPLTGAAQTSLTARPLSKCDVLLYQLFGIEGEEHLRLAIQKQGIGFDASEAFLSDLKKAGASETFIAQFRLARHSDDAPALPCGKSLYTQVFKAVIHSVQKPQQDDDEWLAL